MPPWKKYSNRFVEPLMEFELQRSVLRKADGNCLVDPKA